MKLTKIRNFAALIAATAVMLTGCSASETPSKDTNSTAAASSLPEVVNIGTQQIPDDERLAIEKGFFEEEMGVKVNILEFQAGDIRNAMISKDIDFALLGSSSATLGIANGMDVQLIWIHEVLGDAEQLVARNGTQISSVKDLKGKRVATPFATTTHYSLLKALEENNISETDLTLFDMQMPDVYAAWQRGDIDAAYAWEPTLSKLLENGTSILSSKDMAAKGVVTSNVEIVRREFAEQYPDLVAKYIRALNRAVEYYRENQSDAVKTIAQAMNLTEEEAKKQMQGSIWLNAEEQLSPDYFGNENEQGHLAESLKDTADFLYQQKSLLSQPELSTFEKAVNPAYIQMALQ
ncbi:MAG: Taurine-binding periplasmic protein [Oscillospiraceae bacterium]|jgi:taurine transport system substrate-binding protein